MWIVPPKVDRPRAKRIVQQCAARWVTLTIANVLLSCTRGEALPSAPVAVLSQSISAQRIFRPLEQAWLDGTDRERQGLEAQLIKFIDTFPNDPEARQAQIWLAWLRISKGRFDEALALADKVGANRVGTFAEAIQVLKAAVSTRRGQPEQSLRILEPLSGQIVDSRERDTWAREIILAALRLGHDDDALKWALVWRLESSEDRRASIDREIGAVLDRVSRPALDRLWSQLVAAEHIPTTSPGRKQSRIWMREAVLQRLARIAIDKHDGALARRLLNDAWLPLQKNSGLKRLARVAARGDVELQGLTRTIGIILELDDARSRRRSSELLTGVLQTLDDFGGRSRVRVRTREALLTDREGYSEAVEELFNEGAAILIGGFEQASATELAKNAITRMIPVITLSRLNVAERSDFSFCIDTSNKTTVDAWHQATHGSVGTERIVTDADTFCANDSEAPFEQWQRNHVERILLDCEATCAERLGQAAFDAAHLPAIWLGPKAAEAEDSWQSGQVKGELTFESLANQLPRSDSLERWQKHYLRLPSYFEVLGHDVTVLAASGLDTIPDQVATDPEVRKSALRAVAARLVQSRVALWSNDSNGFDVDHSVI